MKDGQHNVMKKINDNMMKSISIVGVFLIFPFCNNNKIRMNKLTNSTEINDSLVQQWRNDSLGCKGLRNLNLFEKIYYKYEMDAMSKSEIIKLIGEPNFVYSNPGVEALNYYMTSYCKGSSIDSTKNKCWIQVLILKDKKGTNYIKSCDSE